MFFSILLVPYGLLHLYVFLKIRGLLGLRARGSLLFGAFMVLGFVAPVAAHAAEDGGFLELIRIAVSAGFIWAPVVLFLACSLILIDCYRLVLSSLARIVRSDLSRLCPTHRSHVILACFMALVAGAYGFFEARTIGLERITIRTSKVSAPLRIVQISDVHLGLIVGHDRLERIMARVKTAEPDILVSTGDLLDGQTDGIEPLAHLISDLHPRYGSFAVTGNHEFHAGIDHALAFMRKAGFQVLRGETMQAGPITIAGVDDPGRYRGRSVKAGEMDFLTRHLYPGFVLLLRHRPTSDGTDPGTFDLQLSGHTHGGQIFPISLIARFFHQFFAGLYPLPRGSWLYVNRGAGTFGPPLRFLAAPEVTLIELIPIR